MNLVVDYDYDLFLDKVSNLVRESLRSDSELLSLLISSLENSNVCLQKYGHIINSELLIAKSGHDFFTDKINRVCAAIRTVLLEELETGLLSAVNPLLCTFAKSNPPLLVEALELIRNVYVSGNETALSGAKSQAALKYLAFLIDSEKTFRAALGECDFNMCRAIARQSQMDPKFYLPLLSRFEALMEEFNESTTTQDNPTFCFMRFKVFNYLENHEKTIEWGVYCLKSFVPESIRANGSILVDIESVLSTLLSVASLTKSLLEFGISRVSAAVEDIQNRIKFTPAQISIDEIVNKIFKFLNALREAYGDSCVERAEFRAAVLSYLLIIPPAAEKAVRAARSSNDWQLALLLSRQHSALLPSELSTLRIASDLITEYRAGLEQSQSNDYDDLDIPVLSNISSAEIDDRRSRALEASQICLDFCNDSEGAVTILLSTHYWMEAISVAMKVNRVDLFKDEIAVAARDSANVLLQGLKARLQRYPKIIEALSTLWRDPEERLRQVAATDSTIEAFESDTDVQWDSKSEFSAASHYSRASNASNISTRSGTSTVSVLSNLVAESTLSTSTLESAFRIEGLDHSLLSRGKEDKYRIGSSDRRKEVYSEKRERKKERKRGRGNGRDVMELRRETDLSEELLSYSHIMTISESVRSISEALVLIGGHVNRTLVKSIQTEMDQYVILISSVVAPCAPMYPKKWLVKQNMHAITFFQDTGDASAATWWKNVSDGVVKWRSSKISNYL